MALTAIKTPERVHQQAIKVLAKFRRKEIHPGKTHQHGYLMLRVNLHWRLISKNGGSDWELMTCEKYLKEIKK
ncbi:ParE family toxin-like protein [Kosakonia sacchari]|uniref:ParE family toxin-like protein n=1 Tax=Kosakonia sacchari TaxID=1158459 RepID=UPI001585CE9D|nr:hypothetical protein [Kosakonia sacchari]NUL35100.1 hypothetical protein [Kosakonia sacchari]